MPKVSIIIPIHQMAGGADFLWRSINRIVRQTFKDYEIVITHDGKMAHNTNSGIKRARGEIIKILYLDDMFADDYCLQDIVDAFEDPETQWLITGCDTNPHPYWTDDIEKGNNKLGSPSCLAFRNHFANNLMFDERMSWLLDCDYYRRMYDKHGPPKIMNKVNVIMGIGDHQMTNILTYEDKLLEHELMQQKYE